MCLKSFVQHIVAIKVFASNKQDNKYQQTKYETNPSINQNNKKLYLNMRMRREKVKNNKTIFDLYIMPQRLMLKLTLKYELNIRL